MIKIIIEHNIQDNKYENVEDIMAAVEDGRIQRGNSRWYDIDSTVRTAIQMLEKCSNETKKKVALDMAQLVIEKIIQDEDKEELERLMDMFLKMGVTIHIGMSFLPSNLPNLFMEKIYV